MPGTYILRLLVTFISPVSRCDTTYPCLVLTWNRRWRHHPVQVVNIRVRVSAVIRFYQFEGFTGADPGGGGPGGQDPPPFGGPPNFIKKEKMARACARKLRILVLNSYPDPPLSEILYPPLFYLLHVKI